jgi:hypothetical protein
MRILQHRACQPDFAPIRVLARRPVSVAAPTLSGGVLIDTAPVEDRGLASHRPPAKFGLNNLLCTMLALLS